TDQAMVTGATAAYALGFSALGLSIAEAVAEVVVTNRQGGDPEKIALAASALVATAGAAVVAAVPDDHSVSLPLATAQSAARVVTAGALAGTLVLGSDRVMDRLFGERGLPVNLAVAGAVGAAMGGSLVVLRNRRAQIHGEGHWSGRRPVEAERTPQKVARSLAVGGAVGGGLVALAGVQFGIAEGTPILVSKLMGRPANPVTPLVGHVAAATLLAATGAVALNRVRWHVMRADDLVEPAYPDVPTNPHVTAGPNSVVAFDAIGKEGRRFVLMALTPGQITEVMGEPAMSPVRAVAGFGSASTAPDRAKIALAELERLGGFERSVIVVAAPTGVGYVNYSFAEAVEYLTRGDCAIVVPQYALVPSALALRETREGEVQQELILAGIRDRIAQMPEGSRPRLLQFGESLGAEVALDVAAQGTSRFEELGVERGLYLGTPFRTSLWVSWFSERTLVDPKGLIGLVSQASEIADLPESARHIMVIHHDDPINKFDYAALVRAPWWMGPAETRPPGVPKETAFRPVITFIITLIDLKNGMNSKPGQFVRLGHDYRIELREAVQRAYVLPATDEQAECIEQALRDNEREWATRRMVASRFAHARDSVKAQFARWGQDADSMDLDSRTAAELARGDAIRRVAPSPVDELA
ncbi:MAG TPA: alpha/beta-hydrolase family protein, partial [Motilibacterales bacterium]|nr:alpha/beta-hydrolase family protein [Motilibacterales bacterium]